MLLDEPRHLLSGRSSSAAKKADAALRISLARRSSPVLPLELAVPQLEVGRRPGSHLPHAVARAADPALHGLRADTQLARDPGRGPLGPALGLDGLSHQPHGPLPELCCVEPRCLPRRPFLAHVRSSQCRWSLQQTQDGSTLIGPRAGPTDTAAAHRVHPADRGGTAQPVGIEPQPGRPVDFAKAIRHHAGGAIGRVGAGAVAPSGPARQDRPRRPRPTPAIASSAPDDAEVEAYLEVALDAPAPSRAPTDPPPSRPPSPSPASSPSWTSAPSSPSSSRAASASSTSTRSSCPTTRPLAELEARGVRAIILSGGPMSVYDEGAPKPDASIWSGRLPRPRHLLRRPADGAGAGRRRHARGQARVRPGHRPDHPRRRPVRGHRPRAAGVDEPRRLDHPAARRLPRDRPDRLHAVRRPRRPRSGTCTGSSSTPRSPTRRAARTSCATSSPASRGIAPAWTSANFIDTTVAEIRDRVDAHAPRDRLRRQGDLRPLRRRGLRGRRGARPSRGRRPADLHLRRPRADAQEGVGAPARRRSRPTSACAS